jgi:hypothetical protein
MSPQDYCFSTPILVDGLPTVIVTRRDVWQQRRELDYMWESKRTYNELAFDIMHVPEYTAELEENVFQSQDAMSCEAFAGMLTEWGLIHDPTLDVKLKGLGEE